MHLYIAVALILIITVTFLIRAEFAENRKQIFLFKPVSSTLLAVTLLLSLAQEGNYVIGYTLAMLGGIIFSFGGDISMMFKDNPKAFRSGLILFIISHILYAVVLTLYSGFIKEDIISGVILIILALGIFIYLYPGLEKMKIPVLFYILIISFMLNRAISTMWGGYFNSIQAQCIIIGALFFYLSDVILAVCRFRKTFRYNRISLAFYYSGQFLIMISAGLF